MKGLVCRECGALYDLAPLHVCELCFGPLEVTYDYAAIKADISREEIERGPKTVWRYRKLLPWTSSRSSTCRPGSRRW